MPNFSASSARSSMVSSWTLSESSSFIVPPGPIFTTGIPISAQASKALSSLSLSSEATSVARKGSSSSSRTAKSSAFCSFQLSRQRCSHIPCIAEISIPSYPHFFTASAAVLNGNALKSTEFTPSLIMVILLVYRNLVIAVI